MLITLELLLFNSEKGTNIQFIEMKWEKEKAKKSNNYEIKTLRIENPSINK